MKSALILCALFLAVIVASPKCVVAVNSFAASQEAFPAPPADRTLIYIADDKGALVPLPFEQGTTPLRADTEARSNRRSFVELKGARAATIISNNSPRFYLFVPDVTNPHPPYLVRLTETRGARRVTALAQKGLRGFAIASEEIVYPRYRVLKREGGMLFMEIRARDLLTDGEYAFIGSDLLRTATFRVVSTTN
ncbi:MAG: hypothetical protein H0V88_10920 [Pyrinomonadaceae bacterium]|nr:hypothetical protein [Pyrinomonadaceae bacterium]